MYLDFRSCIKSILQDNVGPLKNDVRRRAFVCGIVLTQTQNFSTMSILSKIQNNFYSRKRNGI